MTRWIFRGGPLSQAPPLSPARTPGRTCHLTTLTWNLPSSTPTGPERLPGQVLGRAGSGPVLSLRCCPVGARHQSRPNWWRTTAANAVLLCSSVGGWLFGPTARPLPCRCTGSLHLPPKTPASPAKLANRPSVYRPEPCPFPCTPPPPTPRRRPTDRLSRDALQVPGSGSPAANLRLQRSSTGPSPPRNEVAFRLLSAP